MAKAKGAVGSAVTNRPAYSRVSFLYQAAALLAGTWPATLTTPSLQKQNDGNEDERSDATKGHEIAPPPLQGMARRLLTQMRAVSRKTNMRVRPAVKHRVCKYCDTLLVEGTTCVSVVENHSRGGRKPWADVLSVTCTTCGWARRYPVTAPRQPRRPFREDAIKPAEGDNDGQSATSQADKAQNRKKQNKQAVVAVRDRENQETNTGSGKQRPTGALPASAKQGPG